MYNKKIILKGLKQVCLFVRSTYITNINHKFMNEYFKMIGESNPKLFSLLSIFDSVIN